MCVEITDFTNFLKWIYIYSYNQDCIKRLHIWDKEKVVL